MNYQQKAAEILDNYLFLMPALGLEERISAALEAAVKEERSRCISVLNGIAAALKDVEPAESKAISDSAKLLEDAPRAGKGDE